MGSELIYCVSDLLNEVPKSRIKFLKAPINFASNSTMEKNSIEKYKIENFHRFEKVHSIENLKIGVGQANNAKSSTILKIKWRSRP